MARARPYPSNAVIRRFMELVERSNCQVMFRPGGEVILSKNGQPPEEPDEFSKWEPQL
jgi:hypothetical protein